MHKPSCDHGIILSNCKVFERGVWRCCGRLACCFTFELSISSKTRLVYALVCFVGLFVAECWGHVLATACGVWANPLEICGPIFKAWPVREDQ